MLRIMILLIVFILLLSVLWRRRSSLIGARSEDDIGVREGCRPIKTVFSGHLPLGLDLVWELYKANADLRLMSYFQPFIDSMGPNLELRILGNAGLVTIDPENIKAVLSKSKLRDDGELDWGFGMRRAALLPLFGNGIFTQDGYRWKHSREIMRKQFARIQYHNLSVFAEHVELLIGRLNKHRGSIVDLHPLFCNFSLDTTTALLFGESAGSLRDESVDELSTNLNDASWYSAMRVQLAYLYWICCPPQYFRACDKVKSYAEKWVTKALDTSVAGNEDSNKYDFIRNLKNELKDRELIKEQLVNVLLAGRDSTACLLSWLFRLLIRHQSVLTRLRKEVDAVLGGDIVVTKAKVQQMPYLKCIMTETLRLYPPLPINFREAVRTTILPRGGGPDGTSPIHVKKYMGIGFAPYHMHRSKDLYGEDAFEFRPERWEDGSLMERIGWGYLPFNGGPRICLGREFALLEASYAVARIVQSFPELSLPADEKIESIGAERQSITLTMAPAEGCRVKLGS